MRKATILDRQTIVVPIVGENGKFEARKWLWEYIKLRDLYLVKIEHGENQIRAEVKAATPKEIIF